MNTLEPVRLGIVGCGVIGRIHAKVAAESAFIRPVAVVDIRESAAQEVASLHHIPKAYTSVEQLVADPEVEAVVVALPTGGRLEVALKALSASKHTLVEKPIGMNRAEVEKLIAAQGDTISGCYALLAFGPNCDRLYRQRSLRTTASYPLPRPERCRRTPQKPTARLAAQSRPQRRRHFGKLGLLRSRLSAWYHWLVAATTPCLSPKLAGGRGLPRICRTRLRCRNPYHRLDQLC
jgi:hypothetical protein